MIDYKSPGDRVKGGFEHSLTRAHGCLRGARVLESGLRLDLLGGVHDSVVVLFSIPRDVRRGGECEDTAYGRRAAEYARQLQGRASESSSTECQLLYVACERHTQGSWRPSVTLFRRFEGGPNEPWSNRPGTRREPRMSGARGR